MPKRILGSVGTQTVDGSAWCVARQAHKALPSYTDKKNKKKKNKKKDKIEEKQGDMRMRKGS